MTLTRSAYRGVGLEVASVGGLSYSVDRALFYATGGLALAKFKRGDLADRRESSRSPSPNAPASHEAASRHQRQIRQNETMRVLFPVVRRSAARLIALGSWR
jgi:hypothetical protein